MKRKPLLLLTPLSWTISIATVLCPPSRFISLSFSISLFLQLLGCFYLRAVSVKMRSFSFLWHIQAEIFITIFIISQILLLFPTDCIFTGFAEVLWLRHLLVCWYNVYPSGEFLRHIISFCTFIFMLLQFYLVFHCFPLRMLSKNISDLLYVNLIVPNAYLCSLLEGIRLC